MEYILLALVHFEGEGGHFIVGRRGQNVWKI
jgi:hypothetical protein